MKKLVLLLAAVFAVCFATPAFAQYYGNDNHLQECYAQLSETTFGKWCKSAGEAVCKGAECVVDGVCDVAKSVGKGVKQVGKEMGKCMEGLGRGGYGIGIDPTIHQQKKDKQAKKAGQAATNAGKKTGQKAAEVGKKKSTDQKTIKNGAKRKVAEQKRKNLQPAYLNSTEAAADNLVENLLGHK